MGDSPNFPAISYIYNMPYHDAKYAKQLKPGTYDSESTSISCWR